MGHAGSIEDTPFEESVDELIAEIRRYLETVALFRELGHEPRWRAEWVPSQLVPRVHAWPEAVSRA